MIGEPNPDGTGNIYGMQLPPQRVAAVMARINRLARAAKSADDSRSMDQIRADVFVDLLQGRREAGKGGVVNIHVNLETLMGLSETAADIAGWGPVVADIARQVTSAQTKAQWRTTVTDTNGYIVHVGTTARRPDAQTRRWTEARNPSCVFPGCRMPAGDCDWDHRIPHSHGGPTDTRNGNPMCRHDHTLKDHGWTIVENSQGAYEWTSPLGHTYTRRPAARSP